MRVRFPVLLMVIGLSLSGCAKETWSKAEFVEWYVGFETNKPKIGYCGSDAKYHYFITRPIDSFIRPRVGRSELVIEDERSPSALGERWYFYRVDPEHDFRKVPGSEVTK